PMKLRKSREVVIPFGTVDVMPTLLGLAGLPVPGSVEGTDFSSYLLGKGDPGMKSALIMCPVPFHQWSFENGGREYRGVRTKRYTYAKDLDGPWLLFDNKQDPYQLNNQINKPEYSEIQKELEEELNRLLRKTGDEFREADYYMQKWNYDYD
ncbi:MAG TPA: sulfatase, partial [Bacteroidales bacterium]|nr:sulfatase [Bacteroidales bacterium]